MRPSVLCDATAIEGCEPVKQFDVKKLYKDSPEVSGRLRVHEAGSLAWCQAAASLSLRFLKQRGAVTAIRSCTIFCDHAVAADTWGILPCAISLFAETDRPRSPQPYRLLRADVPIVSGGHRHHNAERCVCRAIVPRAAQKVKESQLPTKSSSLAFQCLYHCSPGFISLVDLVLTRLCRSPASIDY